MKKMTLLMVIAGVFVGGCSYAPIATPPPPTPIRLGRPAYWYAQPAVASVDNPDYDRLWDTCAEVARRDLFFIDRQDYRDGLLVTQPLVSKQIFELWRPDTGDVHEAMENSLQLIRRTIEFQFEKTADGYRVTPKVLIERFAQPAHRMTSPTQYRTAFTYSVPLSDETGAGGSYIPDHWYAIGRDSDMEKQLAQAITDRLK